MQLAGKAALISGAGGGICRAIALAYAEAGASVCCVDIDPEAAAETARLVTEIGGRAVSQGCDVAERGRRRSPRPAQRMTRSAGSTSWSAARRRTIRAARSSRRASPIGGACST